MSNWRDAIRPRNYAVWPLLLEATGSIVWCHLYFLMVLVWPLCAAFGVPLRGDVVIIGEWGTFTLCVTIVQILWGMHLDREDDPTISRLWPYVPLFPLVYWWLLAFTVVTATVPALVMRRRAVRW